CDGTIDLFDILRIIDVFLQRIPSPLSCPSPSGAASSLIEAEPAERAVFTNGRRDGQTAPYLRLHANGRAVELVNPLHTVRALELPLEPRGGPVRVRSARPTLRTNGFVVQHHQADPRSPVKILIVSLDGHEIDAGHGDIVQLRLPRRHGRGRLDIVDMKMA